MRRMFSAYTYIQVGGSGKPLRGTLGDWESGAVLLPRPRVGVCRYQNKVGLGLAETKWFLGPATSGRKVLLDEVVPGSADEVYGWFTWVREFWIPEVDLFCLAIIVEWANATSGASDFVRRADVVQSGLILKSSGLCHLNFSNGLLS